MSSETIFSQVCALLAELFELEAEELRADSRLFEDLDLDSIDAIDLVARLQKMTGKRVEEERLREVKTVGDIVALVESLQAELNP